MVYVELVENIWFIVKTSLSYCILNIISIRSACLMRQLGK